jgi:hypothetical protein
MRRRRLLTVIVIERDEDTGAIYARASVGSTEQVAVVDGPRATLNGAANTISHRVTEHPDFPRFERRPHGE